MSSERLVLSDKYKAFLQCDAPAEFLEGTTAAGKTTVGLFKFILKVAESKKKLHILAADDTGAAEKNIIQKDLGILDDFGPLVEYKGNGSGEYKIISCSMHTAAIKLFLLSVMETSESGRTLWAASMAVCTLMRSTPRTSILFVRHPCGVII